VSVARGTISSAHVPHTVKSYKCASQWYSRICEAHELTPFPLSIDKACLFLNYACLFVSLESASKYLSGLKNTHTLLGFVEIQGDKEILRLTIRGLKRQYPCKTPFHKEPITVMLLSAFLPFLDFKIFFDRLFWSASCQAVYGFWRGSEFMVSKDVCKTHTLKKTDHSWVGVGFSHSTVRLRFTKTQWWQEDVVTHAWGNSSLTSPTHAHRAYQLGCNAAARRSPWLFANEDGSPLLKPQMLGKTKQLAKLCGIDPRRFIASSWRCGAATSAAHAGMSDRVIRALGRWESDAFMRYTFSSTDELRRAGESLGRISGASHVLGEALRSPRGAI
jgi:hypothetical protein